MKVLITTQVFPPEVHPTAVMVKELATDLWQQGFEVTVATGFPHHPYGRLYPGYKTRLLQNDSINGFRVVRGWHLIHPSPALIIRALVMATQCGAFCLDAVFSPRPDVVISYGPPLIGPWTSAFIARSQGARLITVIYDIYPDVAVDLGKLNHPGAIRMARNIESTVYRRSDRIVVLSEGFRRMLVAEKGVPPGKIAVIPAWLDGGDVFPSPRDNLWRREMGISPDKFVVLYSGTIGLVSGAEAVVEAARHLRAYPDILFVLVGAGQAKDRVERLARRDKLENIRFFPFQPRERLSEVQAVADVSLVTLAPGRGKTSVPSKVLGYMAAARPIIAAVDGDCDTAEVIRRAGCGLVVPPAQAEALAKAIIHYKFQPRACQLAGKAGYKYFLSNYERGSVLRTYLALIEKIVP